MSEDRQAAVWVLGRREWAEVLLGCVMTPRLTAMEEGKLRKESADLQTRIQKLRELMEVDARVYEVMKTELITIRDKHAVPRRSIIKAAAGELTEMDLLANERSVGHAVGWRHALSMTRSAADFCDVAAGMQVGDDRDEQRLHQAHAGGRVRVAAARHAGQGGCAHGGGRPGVALPGLQGP